MWGRTRIPVRPHIHLDLRDVYPSPRSEPMGFFTIIGLAALAAVSSKIGPKNMRDLQIDWKDNKLSVISPDIPGGKLDIWYLEAFCRRGSTNRKWEETTLPQTTLRLGTGGVTKEIRLRTAV